MKRGQETSSLCNFLVHPVNAYLWVIGQGEWIGGAFFAQQTSKIPRFEDGVSVVGVGIGFRGKDFSAPDSRYSTFGILGLGSWDRM
jgi:hypothetical protein